MIAHIREKIAELPKSPGVYLMKDAKGKIFYIGKAKSLRDRVRSYFTGQDTRAFVQFLEQILADLEVILTHTEKEALLLEATLIRKHLPRYNIELRDDKRYLSLRLGLDHPYPRLTVVRKAQKDGAKYFGPYDSATAIRSTLKLVNRHFQLRTCTDRVLETRHRPCLQHQIGRCPAPCVFDLSDGAYNQNVKNVTTFLEGRGDELLSALRTRMQRYSDQLNFEAAAQIRDQLLAIEHSLERQRVITHDAIDRDIVGLYREGPNVEIYVMQIRQGKLQDTSRYSFEDLEQPSDEILADFGSRLYQNKATLPDEILFSSPMSWADTLSLVLSEKKGRRVSVLVPQRGNKLRLVQLAERNAKQTFADKERQRGAAQTAIERLQRSLHLRTPPQSIECVDISHHQGQEIVASIVALRSGAPDKSNYRRYIVKSLQNQDDFQAMYEVVSRRLRRGLEHDDLPDLLVIDGGKGQLNAARAALEDCGVSHLDVVGLAKARGEEEEDDTPTLKEPDANPRHAERIFLLGRKNPVVLRQNSAELFLLTRARDEAHRFAITFHRERSRKRLTRSALDEIPGVGHKRRQQLLRTFGSVKQLKQASQDTIAETVGPKLAATIYQHFHAEAEL